MNSAAQLECANWDLTPYFEEFAGTQYCQFRHDLKQDLALLQERVRELGEIRQENLVQWVQLLFDLEEAVCRSVHIDSYLTCLSAADARNEEVQRECAGMAVVLAEQSKIDALVMESFRNVSDELFEKLLALGRFENNEYYLRRMRQRAKYSMPAELETVAAELGINGLNAWGRLYNQVAGQLEFDLQLPDGTTRRVPISLKTSLLENRDPAVRKAALFGSNSAWQKIEDVVAKCLNAISGTRLTLYKWRGIEHFLDAALFDGSISRKTLDTMHEVIAAKRDVCHRYLRLKARLLGKEKLGFQDLAAPLPLEEIKPIEWNRARRIVLDAFGAVYPALHDFAAMAFDKKWIDFTPRPGKRPGGFCSSSDLIRQSRIFMTYNGTHGDIETLAHEIGHAFHSWVMQDLRPWARCYPMTLAETASNFAETVLSNAILEDPNSSEQKRAIVLNARLDSATAYLLNIPMRFIFEKTLYEERAQEEVGIGRLKEIMLAAQRECYGDCLAENEMDPYFWASKLHFYITELSFYNFPYSFGYLFAMGLFARVQQEGPSFLSRYEEVLRFSGSDSAENVARRALGVDLEKPDFWLDSMSIVENDLLRFSAIVPKIFPQFKES